MKKLERIALEQRVLESARRFFLLGPEWNLALVANRHLPPEQDGEVIRQFEYGAATVSYRPQNHMDEQALFATVAHELAHVVLGDYDYLIETLLEELRRLEVPVGPLEKMHLMAMEKTASRLERIAVNVLDKAAPSGRLEQSGT